ncbi:MAG: heme ABC exporter ATP-binding protein CcmA [Acidimicrobiales bacterium]
MSAIQMDHVVCLRGAVALTGRFPALAGVDLRVESGEVVSVVGPNGAGKTSLLRLCAGLLPLKAGEATVMGVDLGLDQSSVRRRVGFLGHSASLYDELTVLENVRFSLRASGASPEGAATALARVGLVARTAQSLASTLSAGQRRRVALAVLLARSPGLWLLDEPHAGLDSQARAILEEVITDAAALGASVLFSSHEAELATALSDRQVALAGGRVIGVCTKAPLALAVLENGGGHVA